MRALFTAATGMEAQQFRIDTVANNLANVNTMGYRRTRAEFEDLFYETLTAPGATSSSGTVLPTGAQIGHGVRLGAITRIDSQGDRVSTGRDLDVAISGDGYFQVETANGEPAFTRDGSFQIDRDGNLVTRSGLLVSGGTQIPTDTLNVTILPDGTVSGTVAGSATATVLGQIEIARFANPSGMRALGGNMLVPTEASGDAETGTPGLQGFGELSQGFLESSNVNIAEARAHDHGAALLRSEQPSHPGG